VRPRWTTVGAMDGGHATGRRGERAAERFLRRRGWTVLARRWRAAGGEIDLVVARGGALVLCEVKTRSDAAALDEPLTAAQRARMRRAARAWLALHPPPDGAEVRMDLITVRPGRLRARVRHLPGAAAPP
jgi:putative endonuclease